MKQHLFFLGSLITILFDQGCAEITRRHNEQSPLNIIWIISDDLGPDLGYLGNEAVRTPNLDQLAEESIAFTNFHTSTPVCSPSRSGMITGMYPVSIGGQQHRTSFKKSLPEGVQPVTEYFREAGYFVTNGNNDLSSKGKTDYNFEFQFDSLYDGIDYRQRGDNQPFFAQIQIFLPHRPFHQDTLHPVDPDKTKIPPYYPDHPITRKDWVQYLETIQHVDEQLGKVMDRLKEDGVLENAVVFFFGDQGRPHVRAKQFLYESGTHTPLLLRFPDGRDAGTVKKKLVSNIDVAPASLNLAGIPIPKHLQGVDFLNPEVTREFIFTAKDRMDGTVDRQRAIRTDRYRLIHNFYPEKPYTQFNTYKETSYPVLSLMEVMKDEGTLSKEQLPFMADSRSQEELYDLWNDPYELNNLAEGAAHQKILADMREMLSWAIETYDQGQYPEDSEEVQRAKDQMRKAYVRKMKRMGLDSASSHKDILKYWEQELEIKE